MRKTVQTCLTNTPQKLSKGWIARQINAQKKCVDKEANQRFHLAAAATSNWRTDQNIRLPAISVEQYVKNSQERHKQSHPLSAAEVLKIVDNRGGNLKGRICAMKSLYCRTQAVGWQFQNWQFTA